jgi:hypothetical protein
MCARHSRSVPASASPRPCFDCYAGAEARLLREQSDDGHPRTQGVR